MTVKVEGDDKAHTRLWPALPHELVALRQTLERHGHRRLALGDSTPQGALPRVIAAAVSASARSP